MAAVVGVIYFVFGTKGSGLVYNIVLAGSCAVVGAVIYFALCYILKVDGLTDIINGILKRKGSEK